MDRLKHQSHTQVRRVAFVLTALSFALTTLSAHASASAEPWVSTKTKAFHESSIASVAGDAKPTGTAAAITEKVSITVALKPHNEAQLDQQVAFAQSGGARQFLTPEQFANYYGATQQDIAKVIAHLRKAGYSDITVSPNRLFITATGTPEGAKNAFNTSLKAYKKAGHNVFVNNTDAQVPRSLSNIVDGVIGLQTAVTSHTFHHVVPQALVARATSKIASDAIKTNATTPVVGLHDPLDFGIIYGNTPNYLYQAWRTTVGIVSWGNVDDVAADLNLLTTQHNLAKIPVTVVNVGTASHTVNNSEWQLDSQAIVGASGGLVKGIIFYNASDIPTNNNILLALNKVVTDNKVKVVNMSFGEPEGDESYRNAANLVFKQGVLQGITFSASAGDAGAYEDAGGAPVSHTSVSLPATSPYVVSVGGTELSTIGATTYASETTWNEGLAWDADLGANRLWSTGGGYSAYEPAPSWQPSSLTGSTFRAIPDIAFDASGASGSLVYYHGDLYGVGGTSLASPIFVGLWSRIESGHNNTLGFPITNFYKYFPTATTAGLHDVTTGNNGYTGYPSFSAKKGWDATTGFGSFNDLSLYHYVGSQPTWQ